MRKRDFYLKVSAGFTLIELLISISIASILLGFITMNLLHAQQNASVSSVVDEVDSDLRGQQLKAMNGTMNSGSKTPFGIYFQSDKYVLFSGSSYNPADVTNYVTTMDSNITLIPSPTQQILFSQLSGESAQTMTITVKSSVDNEQQTIYLNSLGVVTSIH